MLLGVLLLVVQAYLLPRFPLDELVDATPTMVGLSITPSPRPTVTLISGAMPTITTTVPPPPPPVTPTVVTTEAPLPTETPVLTGTPEPQPSIRVGVQVGNVAILEGYDVVAVEVTTGDGVGVILYWRALEGASAVDYTVFTHLLSPELQLIAQHDGVPVGGTRPTTTWEPGELVVDYHQMVFKEEALDYTGPAQISVGLYNPAAPEERVPVATGGDAFALPTPIQVVAP
jgi:hypothetical protein